MLGLDRMMLFIDIQNHLDLLKKQSAFQIPQRRKTLYGHLCTQIVKER